MGPVIPKVDDFIEVKYTNYEGTTEIRRGQVFGIGETVVEDPVIHFRGLSNNYFCWKCDVVVIYTEETHPELFL